MLTTPRKRGLLYRVGFFVLAASYGFPANGTIVHLIDVAALVESSDVIISGTVVSISEDGATRINTPGGSLAGRKLLAVLAADETLKGDIQTTDLSIEFAIPEAPSPIRGIPLQQYGIFFLQRQGSHYRLSDPVYPFLPAVHDGRSTSELPLDRVIAKLGDVLTYNRSTEFETSSALEALATIQGKSATATLRHALETSSDNRQLQLRIASKLVARNDITGLDLVERALMHPAVLSDCLIGNLSGSLGGLKDPRAVPALKRLLETGNQNIVKGVAIALRQSGSKDALKPLSYLLDSEDEQVRYYAVVGMGEITKQHEWTPAYPEFHEHEAKYLSHWREWAASNLPQDSPK
jgi:hypothetical protein